MAIFWLIFIIVAMAVAGVLAGYNPDPFVLNLPYQWGIRTTVLEVILCSLGIGGGFVFLQQYLKGRQTKKQLREYEAQLATLRECNQQLLLEAEKHRSEVALITSRLAEIQAHLYLGESGPPPALEDHLGKQGPAAEASPPSAPPADS